MVTYQKIITGRKNLTQQPCQCRCICKGCALSSNEYLTEPVQQKMGELLMAAFRVGTNLAAKSSSWEKKHLCDITYSTNSRIGFDTCVTTWLCVQKTWFNVHWTMPCGRWGRLNLDWRRVLVDRFWSDSFCYEPALSHSGYMWRPWREDDYIIDVPSKTIGFVWFRIDKAESTLILKTCTILKT